MAIDTGVRSQLVEHVDKNLHLIAFEDSKEITPHLALAEQRKIKDGFGRNFIVRFETNEGAAVAAQPDVADEIAGDGSAGGRPERDRFVVSTVSLDSPFVFDRAEILAIEGKNASEQFDVISSEMENSIKRIRNVLAEQVSGNGWGALAQISAISSTTITVPDWAANRFRVGWRLVASNTEDTDVLYGTPAGAQLRVTAIAAPSSGTVAITLSGNPVTTWDNSTDFYVFRAGNRIATDPAAAESAKLCISGLKAHVDPDSTTLWGVTRTGNPDLTGHDVNCASAGDTHECLLEIAERAFIYGRKIDTILVSARSWKLLNLDKDALKTVPVDKNGYTIGFKAFELPTSFGSVHVAPDAFMQPGYAWAGPFQDKEKGPRLYYAGKNLINIDDTDGQEFVRRASTGSRDFAGQMYFSGQYVIPTPGLYFRGRNLPT